MLNIFNLKTCYGNICALHGINVDIAAGEIVALLGANGAGKTTTLMSISGILPPSSGEIIFRGRPIHHMAPNKIVELGISHVPEGRRIFPQLSVMENLDTGAFLRRDRFGIKEDLEYVFELFPILAERKNQDGGTLSGGEQQMLAISRALMARPRLLLLDEPSLGLAPLVIKQIFKIIKKINQQHHTTIFLVEQNANQALQVAHRCYVMENGTVTMSDTAENLLENDNIRRAYLG